MDKNTIIGILLIAAVIIGFGIINTPSQEEINAQRAADSIALEQSRISEVKRQIEKDSILNARQDTLGLDTTSLFGVSMHGKGQLLTLQNDVVKLEVNTHGGVISKAVLKAFKNQEKTPVVLFDENNSKLNFVLEAKNENVNTKDLFFTPSEATDSTLTLVATTIDGGRLTIDYHLCAETYLVNMTLKGSKELDKSFSPSNKKMLIEWSDSIT